MTPTETIVAIATPPGESAIGVVRLSGPSSLQILSKLFFPSSSDEDPQPRRVYHGWMQTPDSHRRIDEVLVTCFHAPHSYTGEDLVEISAHGSMVALRTIVDAARSSGARMAEPGEFTRRAFLNGKLSLDAAEAVVDVITARSEASLKAATQHLSGSFARAVEEMRQTLTLLMAHVEATLDFTEDEIDAMDPTEMQQRAEELLDKLREMLSTYEHGRILREGIQVALVGPPNVGKSSLLNALLRYERALVTPIPGTTRDTVEEPLLIKGIPVKAIDTAGLRVTEDPVELLGMERTQRMIAAADIVILILDASQPLSNDDRRLLNNESFAGKKVILCLNKIDLPRQLRFQISDFKSQMIVETSALTGKGLEALETAICETLPEGLPGVGEETMLVTRLRHKELLEQTADSLERAVHALAQRVPLDCVSIDFRDAYLSLGKITGADVGEDLLDRIFSEFCIGK